MTHHLTLLRTLLLGAVGATFWACSTEECDPSASTSGDGDESSRDRCAGTPTVTARECTNPFEEESGFVRCDEGFSHRPRSPACPNLLPRDEAVEWPPSIVGMGGAGGAGDVPHTVSADECGSDADCGALEYCAVIQTNQPGYHPCSLILTLEPEIPDYARVCLFAGDGCVTDEDCASDQYCSCGTLAGNCVAVSPVAGCRTDDDCEGAALCLNDARSGTFAESLLACQLPGDECEFDSDCGPSDYCGLASEDGRSCQPRSVCGRPFLVQGVARLAVRTKGSDWPFSIGSVILPEGPELRGSLAEHFTRVGLMEHASVAAFARFTLQLLSLGAPAELIEASLVAQGDETRHARLAFAVATAHAGELVGPGALTLEGAFDNASWESLFEATVREGCIGETRAALEAHSAAAECEDPIVAEILRGIAADESQHASLAWRVAAWMLEQKPELASLARALFAEEESFPEGESYRPEGARAYGVLSAEELKTSWSRSRKEVIVPCARALLSKTDRPSRNLLVAVEAARS